VRREIELRRRLRSLEALGEAVTAMKSLSAHHFRDARREIEPARTYRVGVERLLRRSGATLAAGPNGAGLVVIGAELGLCGSYNARVVEEGAKQRRSLGAGPTFCVGHRAATLLERRGVRPDRTYAGPTSVGGITTLLLPLAEDVLTTYASRGLSRFDIVFSRFVGVGTAHPVKVGLLPLEPRPAEEVPPPRYVRANTFASAAVREFLYIALYDLLLDALASEHGARLVATLGAEKWLDDRTTVVSRNLASTRRETSTQEMIEIAAAARARRGA
jgi:F-type H+-transporting ATPase subunit gamma